MRSPARAILPSPVTKNSSRGAFTLLEVMVALALSTMLVAAVYASLNLYWQYSTTGQDEVERAQLARAVLRQIELDLRSVLYKAAQAEAADSGSAGGTGSSGGTTSSADGSTDSSASGGTDTSTDSSTTTVEVVDPETAYTTTSSGLYGNASMLMMHISKPMPELTFMPNAFARTSDLVAVAYYVASDASAGSAQAAGGASGLARMEGDRLAMSLATQGGGSAMSAAQTQILAPEVTALQFSYFDGLNWREDWDSELLGGIPRAVEVVVQIGPSQSLGSTKSADAPNVYRLVVFLPLAKPVDTSTATY